MLCEECNKSIATVHLTEIDSGQRHEKHLCEECARSMNLPHKHSISISELLGALLDKEKKKGSSSHSNLECPNCGITFEDFKEKGRLGCANDYDVFKEKLDPLLKKVHGSTKYIGKSPAGTSMTPVYQNELMKLNRQLKKVIQAEAYEEAAKIRDRILELETLVGKKQEEVED